MSDEMTSYPFDPTGLRSSNKIEGEKQVLTPPAWKDFHFIIPKLAPYFRDTMEIFDVTNNRPLEEGVDWIATHRFMDASRATAKAIYGSITFYDKYLSGVVSLKYQTLGGDWVIDSDTIAEILVNKQVNPRITTWGQIVDVPYQFPVIDHEWHLDDMVGMSEVEASIRDLTLSVEKKSEAKNEMMGHVYNRENPHEVTKEQVGLGNVEDYTIADEQRAVDGATNARYMTPLRTRQAIDHRVSQNYYTQSEVDGMFNSLVQLIEDLGGADNAYSTHLASTNPHQVTADQVGLGSLENTRYARVSNVSDVTESMLYDLMNPPA